MYAKMAFMKAYLEMIAMMFTFSDEREIAQFNNMVTVVAIATGIALITILVALIYWQRQKGTSKPAVDIKKIIVITLVSWIVVAAFIFRGFLANIIYMTVVYGLMMLLSGGQGI